MAAAITGCTGTIAAAAAVATDGTDVTVTQATVQCCTASFCCTAAMATTDACCAANAKVVTVAAPGANTATQVKLAAATGKTLSVPNCALVPACTTAYTTGTAVASPQPSGKLAVATTPLTCCDALKNSCCPAGLMSPCCPGTLSTSVLYLNSLSPVTGPTDYTMINATPIPPTPGATCPAVATTTGAPNTASSTSAEGAEVGIGVAAGVAIIAVIAVIIAVGFGGVGGGAGRKRRSATKHSVDPAELDDSSERIMRMISTAHSLYAGNKKR